MNEAATEHCDYIVKFATFGGKISGKTSILSRLCYDEFSGVYNETIGIDFYLKNITLAQKKVKIQLWDIEVTPKSQSNHIRQMCLKGMIGLIVVYSITDSSSFDYAQRLLSSQISKEYLQSDIIKILVANKGDLQTDAKISQEIGQNLAKSYGMEFLKVSAKDCRGMKQLSMKIST